MGTRLQWEQCHNEVHEYHIPPLITRLYRHRTRSSLSCAEAQLKLSERPSLCALKHAYNTVSGSEQIKERLWALSAILSARYHHHRASMGPSFRASTMAAYGVIATWVTAPGQQYALFAFVNWASRPSLQCQALHHPIPHQVPASSCMPYFKRAFGRIATVGVAADDRHLPANNAALYGFPTKICELFMVHIREQQLLFLFSKIRREI